MSKKHQLRGKKLLSAIESCLRQLASEKEKYVYNASELSRRVGCSRPTLDNKSDFIDEVLTRIGAEKRMQNNHPLLEHLHTRIEKLESDKKELDNELAALRTHHAEIYSILYMQSIDAALLIKPIIVSESIKNEKCILCGEKIEKNHNFPHNKTVVSLADHKNKGK